ncbi:MULTISPECIES: BPSS1780 family membrane protein [Thiorhodovibrio]|uniref:BPSS1780 family membrane protein n=1 Tax=Thiorhodovibrio TaxID=61593 RepID=UPI0019129E1D|nr:MULTISPECIES: BPSS1780 family membrane protein [Thiorhodovibrio]WPL10755.1 putative integral membrane protein [Thiorhodovibrio litoralis]
MSQLCTVVFTGQLKSGIDPQQAATKFASIFKVPEEKALRLIRDGREKALKKDVDPAAAAHYRDVLADIGLIARIDANDGSSSGTDSSTGTAANSAGMAPPPPPGTARPVEPPRTAPPAFMPPPAAAASSHRATTPEPAVVPMGHGLSWIVSGWGLFKQAPLAWIGALLVFMLINIALALVPVIGSVASMLISPVLIGGLMAGAHAQASGEHFGVGHLFEGFKNNTASLLGVGGLYMLGSIVLAILAVIIMIGPIMGAAGGMDTQALENNPELFLTALGPTVLVLSLIILALAIPLVMAYWFAPALVMLNGLGPVAAMKLSFHGCLKNVLPFLIYGLVGSLLMILAIIPFGLGLLILSPVLLASMYAAYRDIF